MDFLKALMVILLIQRCDSDDQSTSSLPSTAGMPQGSEAFAQGPELPPEEIVLVVSPPSLEEVEQAVQVASEQVEGGGAEEVLKELLERVVGAALGEVGREVEEKENEAGEQRSAVPEAGAEKRAEAEAEHEVKIMEQAAEEEEEEVSFEEAGNKFKNIDGQETITTNIVDPGKDAETAAEGTETGEGERESAAEPAEETNTVADIQNVISVPLEKPGVTQEVEEEAVAALDAIRGEVVLQETGDKGEVEQEIGAKMQEAEDTLGVEEVVVGGDPEQETVEESGPSLEVGGSVEQTGFMEGGRETKEVETVMSKVGGGATASETPPDDREDIETIQSVLGEAIEVEKEEEEWMVKEAEETERERGREQSALVGEGGALEEADLGDGGAGEQAESDGGGENVLQESHVLVDEEEEEPDHQEITARGEEQTAMEASQASQVEDKEVLLIPAPDPRVGAGRDDPTSTEQGPNNQATPLSPFISGGEIGSNTVVDGEEKVEDESNHVNEITSTDDLLPHDPVVDNPTLDNFVEEVPATPGETNELVEDIAESTEASEPSLEAWKIGAISAAVFLVMETTVIIVYILKCHNKTSSATAPQRACEEGFVEPDAATGADCSDETLPEDNGDSQQIAELQPLNVASTLAQNKEKQQEEQGAAMLHLSLVSSEESANPGPAPDSSQDLRTSIL